MSDKSAIEWTDATWNPTRGCTKVSPGCKHCYAETFAGRFEGVPGHPYELGFAPRLAPDKLADPLKWTRPRRVFVNSMSDLFHESFSDAYIAAVYAVMAACPQHTFQVLTKRAERMVAWFAWLDQEAATCNNGRGMTHSARCLVEAQRFSGAPELRLTDAIVRPWPLQNVWMGVSVEDQPRANERVSLLRKVPATVRFLSCEPLLGPVNICATPDSATRPAEFSARYSPLGDLQWVICGGESGQGGRHARPMHPAWARSLRDQCAEAGVPFFFKQWGTWQEIPYDHESPPGDVPRERYLNLAGGHGLHGEEVVRVRSSYRRTNGRLLDGVLHSAFPTVAP